MKGIYGHELIVSRLERTLQNGRISNAYLFVGPEGVGKKTTLRQFVLGLLCERENAPCGQCAACVKVQTGNHPDVVYLRPEKDKKSISVDVVRDAIGEVYVRPLLGTRKLFVVEDGALLGTAAQNALLKVLEEPPDYVVFLMAAHSEEVFLPTILSRSQVLRFRPLANRDVEAYVRNVHPELGEQIPFIVAFAGGSIGKAVQLAENEDFARVRGEVNNRLKRLSGSKESALQELIAYVTDKNADLELILPFLLLWFRDCLLIQIGRKQDVVNQDLLYELSLFGASKQACASAVERILALRRQLDRNANAALAVNGALLGIWEDIHPSGAAG